MFLALLVVVLVAMILSFALPSTVGRVDSRRSTSMIRPRSLEETTLACETNDPA